MPAKLIGILNFYSGTIRTNGITPIASKTAYLSTLHIFCVSPGQQATVTVQSKERVLFSGGLSASTVNVVSLSFGASPIVMKGGIDVVVASGTTPPELNYWLTYSQ